jgi:hypothetical protein
VWDAVRTDAVRLLDDPKLHVGLATYFEDLAEVARLQRELIDTKIGLGSTFTNAEKIRNQLFDVIDDATGRLLDESDRLVSDVQRAAKSSEASLSSRAR